MEILIILALVLLNGLFAMAELSLVSSRKFKLESAKRSGHSGAKTALELQEHPTQFLSTVQIGITLIGILLGVYSGENLTEDLAIRLSQLDLLRPYAHQIATACIVLVVTYFSIVLGELLPKRIGMSFPEPIIMALAKPMKWLSAITAPFVWLLTKSNNLLLDLLGLRNRTAQTVSEEEIISIVKESADGGIIQEIEQDIVNRVFEFGDRRVDSIYTHRSEITFLSIDNSWQEIKSKIKQDIHSAYPVSESQDLDDIVGIVLLKDLFSIENPDAFDIKHYLVEPIYFNENTKAYKVFETFKERKFHYGIVFDEYGTMQGMVTMDDVIDGLIGYAIEDDDELQLTPIDDDSWWVDGQFPILDFIKYFDIQLDARQKNKFNTVAGLMIHTLDSIPKVGDTIKIENLLLEVADKDGQKIDKILVKRMSE